jgi:spore germination cell wall hydrolase CwlJ-like protein
MIEALVCLATAIYFEARGEPTVGQIAVGQVIMSRVADHRYPDNVCDVVKEGYYYSWNPEIPIPDKCQFSFWCDGKDEKITDQEAYKWAEEISWGLLDNTLSIIDLTDGATHYHAWWVKPSWSDMFTRTVRIDDHIFYRWEME